MTPPETPSALPARGGRLQALFFQPVLASLMGSRPLALAITGMLGLQFGLSALGLPALPCPVATLTPSHCPGCGVSRSIGALLQGDWFGSFSLHAFGSAFLLGALLIAAAALLPGRLRDPLVATVRRVEERTGLSSLVILAAVAYWAVRMASGNGRIPSLG